jgi:NitT/TauT family transport system substrate-binding protein
MDRPKRAAAAVVAAITAVAAAFVLVAARGLDGEPQRLTIAVVRQPATSLVFIAGATGCFRDERLDVAERNHELGRDALVDLLDGRADVAIAYETPVLRRYRDDPRLRILSTLHSSTRNTRVVARRDRGIARIADLRGRRLGAAAGTNADFFVEHLLTFGDLSRADVAVVDVEPSDAVAALSRGELDAAVLSDPHAERARRALGVEAVELVSDVYAEFSVLSTRSDVIASRREALLALLRALACAERALAERPAEAYAAVRARFPERSDAELRGALERVRRGVGLDEVLVSLLERETWWMFGGAAAGHRPLDIATLVDGSLLAEVEPSAVNMMTRR